MSETLTKASLFWDVKEVDPKKNQQFVIERVLDFGDVEDFHWARDFYGGEKIKEGFLKSKSLSKKSNNFWCLYFDLDKNQCIQNQSTKKPNVFLQR